MRSRSLPHSLVRRAQIVLLSADGAANREVARRCGISAPVVSLWRQRYQQRGIAGLHAELRPGRPRSHSDEQVAALLRSRCCTASPPRATSLERAQRGGTYRHLQEHGRALLRAVRPATASQQPSFKLSTDPFFVEKVRDIVGLYLNPPDNALVLSRGREEPQVQALERTQPVLPIGLGYVEGVTHDYYRHGTTTLFAALDIVDGGVISQCKPRHRHQEFLSFLKHLDANIPADLEMHLIADRLRDSQASQGQSVARAPSALSHPLHAYLLKLAQPDRALVRAYHPAGDPARSPFRNVRELVGQDRRLRGSLQRPQAALRLRRLHRRLDIRQTPAHL